MWNSRALFCILTVLIGISSCIIYHAYIHQYIYIYEYISRNVYSVNIIIYNHQRYVIIPFPHRQLYLRIYVWWPILLSDRKLFWYVGYKSSKYGYSLQLVWSSKIRVGKILGAVSIRKTVLPGMAIPMLKIRRPNGRLIFNMEITIRR